VIAGSTRPSVTVVVPNYNHARYLDQCLQSILAQSLSPDRVIIVDDASTDDSLGVINRFLHNPRWELVQNDTNRGVIIGQNVALSRTGTDWITFLGADDVWHPSYIEKVMDLAQQFPESGFVCACAERFGSSITPALRPIVLPRLTRGPVSADRFRALLSSADNFFLGTVSTYRCAIMRELGGFDAGLGAFADAMLARQLAVRCGFAFIPEVLGFWRMHGDNYSTTTSMDASSVNEKMARVHSILAAEPAGLFPKGYADLLDRRQRFGSARLLVLARHMPPFQRARMITSLLHGGLREESWLRVLLSAGRIGMIGALAWLTVRLRPTSPIMLITQARARRAIFAASAGYRP
jgi:glycosyltransferase involved in cell wall biosynthesis